MAGRGISRGRSCLEEKQAPGQSRSLASGLPHPAAQRQRGAGVHGSVRTKLASLSPGHRLSGALKASVLSMQLAPEGQPGDCRASQRRRQAVKLGAQKAQSFREVGCSTKAPSPWKPSSGAGSTGGNLQLAPAVEEAARTAKPFSVSGAHRAVCSCSGSAF